MIGDGRKYYGISNDTIDELNLFKVENMTFSHNGKDFACFDNNKRNITFYNENLENIYELEVFSETGEVPLSIDIDFSGIDKFYLSNVK